MAKKTNFESNGKQYYRVVRTIGHKADGTPIKKQFYGKGVKEANEKADAYMNDLKNGLVDSTYTINTLLPKWLFNVKKNEIKASSFESYYGTYKNFIEPEIVSNIPIKEIKALKLQELYNKLSTNQAKKVYKLLNQFFKYAESQNYLFKNPNISITLKKDKKEVHTIIAEKKTKFQYFTKEEIPELLEIFKPTRYYDIVRFALGTGMRRGEILGLQWEDIDFSNKEIYVRHNLSYMSNITEDGEKSYTTILQTPKSQNAVRIIPMSDVIYTLLKELPHNCEYVFSTEKNKHFDVKWFERAWRNNVKGTKFEDKRFHDLRHTFATLLLTNGADLITVKELLGHSSVTITEMYLDALPKTKQDIVNKIDFI